MKPALKTQEQIIQKTQEPKRESQQSEASGHTPNSQRTIDGHYGGQEE